MPSSSQALRALLKIEDLSPLKARFLIDQAINLKQKVHFPIHQTAMGKVVGLVFFEPSTRTRVSFEVAAHRLGVRPVIFTADSTTSLEKGESLGETLGNILAMDFDALVVRHPGDEKVEELLRQSRVPIVNAGDGKNEHPTQALLDAMTVFERRGQVEGEKVLYVGDVEHSRVARSGRHLFQQLGAEVAICAPEALRPLSSDWNDIHRYESLREALAWCTVCVGLRMQKERHGKGTPVELDHYVEHYRLDKKNISALAPTSLIMHPGPFVSGVDLAEEILSDARCAIYDQVTNGVYMRMAILGELVGVSYT